LRAAPSAGTLAAFGYSAGTKEFGMRMINRIAKTAFSLLLLAAGCTSQVGDARKESPSASGQALTACDDDTDCPGGFRCDIPSGTCFTGCGDGHISTVCKEGYTCGDLSCGDCVLEEEYPQPPVPTPCDEDSDCPGGFRCAYYGYCFTGCGDGHISTVCKEGYTCTEESCDQCVPE
jgi:hypothetical protein